MKTRPASLRRSVSDNPTVCYRICPRCVALLCGLDFLFLLVPQSLNNTGNWKIWKTIPKQRKVSPFSFTIAFLRLSNVPGVDLLTRATPCLGLEMQVEVAFAEV